MKQPVAPSAEITPTPHHVEATSYLGQLPIAASEEKQDKTQTAINATNIPLVVWCIVASSGTYFCMYAFRMPFKAALFKGQTVSLGGSWVIDYKALLIIAQVFGYSLSKFIGIKIISEISPARRAAVLLLMIGLAELALLGFALTPFPYAAIFLFFNGLPLGMVFGLVLGFLEGRKVTEILTAFLCASFISADGVTKSVGSWLISPAVGVSEQWMPFFTGLVFMLPLVLFTLMLAKIPWPNQQDIVLRSDRQPMSGTDRWNFFRRYAPGLVCLIAGYLFVTILRSLRSDFMPEIFSDLGENVKPAVFAQTENWVMIIVAILTGATVFVRHNAKAFYLSLGIAASGAIFLVLALLGHDTNSISPKLFMILLGLGLYLPYVVVHVTVFERLIAMTRERSNIGYLMYLVDSFGYLGYVVVLLGKNLFWKKDAHILSFLIDSTWIIAIATVLCFSGAGVYYYFHPQIRGAQPQSNS